MDAETSKNGPVEAVKDYNFIYNLDHQRRERYDEENIDTFSNDFTEINVIPISVVYDNTEEGISSNPSLAKMIEIEISNNGFEQDVCKKSFHNDNHMQSSEHLKHIEIEREFILSAENNDSVELDEDTVFLSSDSDDDNSFNETENKNENINSDLSNDSDGKNLLGDPNERKECGKSKLSRKRKRHPEKWKRNIRKKAVNSGQEYISPITEKIVPARTMKQGCGPGCRFKCESRISDAVRGVFFADYWSTDNQSRKYDFIARYVKEVTNKEVFTETSTRNYSRTYTIANKNGKVEVCQTMFCNTLNISKQVVYTALNKERKGDPQLLDKRGTSAKRPRHIDEIITQGVREHINMFPKVESHFCRRDSTREYLEGNLNYAVMYRLYVKWTEENKRPHATLAHYKNVFDSEFNLGFFKPKKDQCDTCESYKNANEQDKEKLQEKYNEHIANKETSRKLKDNDKIFATANRNDTVMACFDFEKILATPQTEASCLYYKRKLSVSNFTIYNVISHKASCYVWNESEAKKGSNEVASCLFDYIEKNVTAGINNFFFWSDNCAGQNRNSNVFGMYVFASAKFQITIKHSFLEVGHTQNEGDSVHAVIERYGRGRKIYTEHEWVDVIRNAKQTQPQYEVCPIKFDSIYDFKSLSSKMNWKKTVIKNRRTSTVVIGISKIKQVLASNDKLNQLQYKTDFNKYFETLVTRKGKENANVKKYTLTKAYTDVQGIAAAKKKDLLDLCKALIIPVEYHEYYNRLPVKKNAVADESDCVLDTSN